MPPKGERDLGNEVKYFLMALEVFFCKFFGNDYTSKGVMKEIPALHIICCFMKIYLHIEDEKCDSFF